MSSFAKVILLHYCLMTVVDYLVVGYLGNTV